jgi:ArsR family transcriptional regulator
MHYPPHSKKEYEESAAIHRILSNPTRLEILDIIKSKKATVNEISKIVGVRKANTSQHLSILRHLNMVARRKEGKNTYYRITDPKIEAALKLIKLTALA